MRKCLHGILAAGLAISTIGAGFPPPVPVPMGSVPGKPSGPVSEAAGVCLTQPVRITLASEQVSFCAPTDQPFSAAEDSASDPAVNYAGLSQLDGYGILNIKATAPGNMPGTGRPVYTSGGIDAYRQAVWDMETARPDRSVSTKPGWRFLE